LLLSLLGDDKLCLEETMKRNAILMYVGVLSVLLSVTLALSGCAGAGETRAELARRRDHTMKRNMLLIQDDIDAVLMLDKTSKTTEKIVRP
jgi:hypothetical protein